jgi:hypothetical protein
MDLLPACLRFRICTMNTLSSVDPFSKFSANRNINFRPGDLSLFANKMLEFWLHGKLFAASERCHCIEAECHLISIRAPRKGCHAERLLTRTR